MLLSLLSLPTEVSKVIATARTQFDLRELGESHENITALQLDVHEEDAILALKQKVEQITGGGLDYLVNNAGAHYASPNKVADIRKGKRVCFNPATISVQEGIASTLHHLLQQRTRRSQAAE